MTFSQLAVYVLKFFIPGIWSFLFRAAAFGYSTKRRLALGIAVYCAYMLCVPAWLMTVLGYGEYTHVSWLVTTAGVLSVLIFTTDSFGKTIFLQLAQGGILTVLSVILNMVRTVLNLSYPALLVMLGVASPLLFFFALRYWAKPMRFLVDNIQDGIGSLLALPLLTLVVVNLIPVYPRQNFANHPVFCTLMMLAMELSFFLYLYTMYRNLRRINALSREKSRMELLSQEIATYQAALDTAAQNRHDLRHHDALLTEYLEQGDTGKALAYLHAHDSAIAEGKLEQFCAEPTVNAVLRIYGRQAEDANVEFAAVAELPQTLPLDAPELGGLFSNILENALCAAQGVPGGFITLETRIEDGNLLLEVKNSVAGHTEFRNDLPVSQKPGGGIGTQSILAAAKRHGGIALFSQAENAFCTRVILPLQD